MSIRKKSIIILLLIYIASLPILFFVSYQIIKKDIEQQISEEAELMLTTMNAIRNYSKDQLRPAIYRVLPEHFIIEALGFKMVYEINKEIKQKFKGFNFKIASDNPMNPADMADEFEMGKINEFRKGILKDGWRGFEQQEGGESYVIMKPVIVDNEMCLQCHSNPANAPPEQLKRYGDSSGYNWKMGDLVGISTIYIPAEETKKRFFIELFTFTIIYSGIFLVIIIAINRFINGIIINKVIETVNRFVDAVINFTTQYEDKKLNVGVKELKPLEDAYEKMKTAHILSIKDHLTGCFNRRKLDEDLEYEIARHSRFNRQFSIMMIDIDWFKCYNDFHGHQRGDELLKNISSIFFKNIRSTDKVYRYGGEEFLILLPETTKEDGIFVAEKIRKFIRAESFEGERESQPNKKVTVSIGIATFPLNAKDKNSLIEAADCALYSAKQAGKDRVNI